jgi:hypothetical protein
VCLDVLTDRVRVQIPQLFAAETIPIYDFAGGRPAAGDQGWVSFEAEQPDRPVWIGSESKGSGGAAGGYPPYLASTVNIAVDHAQTGLYNVTLLDGTVAAALDGWVEILVNGGYAGLAVNGPINARQAIFCPTYQDPTGQAWVSAGRVQNIMPGAWDLIGDCQLNIPVAQGDMPLVYWQGQWSPSSYQCSYRSYASIKWFSSSSFGDISGGGAAPSHGLPPGGTTGQVLAKESSSDYDTHWVTAAGLVASYHYIQTTPVATWTIVHNLGFYPNVTVVDSSHREVVGEISYVDVNTVQIIFSAAFGGDAYLS